MAKSKWPEVQQRLEMVEGWARNGLTDEEMAKNLSISASTFYDYKAKYAEFSEALKKNKELADLQVEGALFKKTQGYNAVIRKTFKCKRVEFDIDTGRKILEQEELVTAEDEVHVPADTTAQIFWLKNRRPAQWRDKPEGGGEEREGTGVVLIAPVENVRLQDGGVSSHE